MGYDVEVQVYRNSTKVVTLYGYGHSLDDAIEDAFGAMVCSEDERPRRGDEIVVINEFNNLEMKRFTFDRETACRFTR